MRLEEVASKYEQRKVFMYAKDGNKVVRHNKMMRKIVDNIYIGEIEKDEYGQKHYSVYLSFDGVERGMKVDTCPGWYVEDPDGVERTISRVGTIGTVDGILEKINEAIKNDDHIPMLYIEFISQIRPELVSDMMESRKNYGERMANKRAERRAKEQAEETEYVNRNNEEAEKKVSAALEVLKNGGVLKNETVEFYKNRYDHSEYSIVNYLCRKYGVKLPIRTAGWVNSSLASLIIKDGKCERLQYYKRSKNATASNAIYGYINQLIAAVGINND